MLDKKRNPLPLLSIRGRGGQRGATRRPSVLRAPPGLRCLPGLALLKARLQCAPESGGERPALASLPPYLRP
jgi:hypothetical protein